ncbi:MAG TPA: FAD-dependent oxidoreductase [Terriglobales bacterium]|nr:FAD-dependent oxidoreductase [Terriglobales bacterium]
MSSNANTYDVVIIGAGIVGAACARECAHAGLRVAAVEADYVGGGATSAGMGHIVVMDDSEPQFALTRYSQQLWLELAPELPPDVEYMDCGTLWIAADDQDMQEVRRKQQYYGARRVPTEILDPHALYEAEPHLRPGLVGALLVPEDLVIYAPCAARFLMRQARAHSCDLYLDRVTEIRDDGVVLQKGGTLSAGTVINAAGTWAPELTPGLEMRPRKGHLIITDRYPGFVRHQLVELGYLKSAHVLTAESFAFNVQPRVTGQLLIGSSRQFGVEGKGIDNHIVAGMLARACEYLPELAKMSAIRCWTGFRAATADKLPVIGKCPGRKNLYLATGHEGLGITTSLATGRLLLDQLLQRTPAIPVEPYSPSRDMEVAHA